MNMRSITRKGRKRRKRRKKRKKFRSRCLSSLRER
jgi:hypothetical protein